MIRKGIFQVSLLNAALIAAMPSTGIWADETVQVAAPSGLVSGIDKASFSTKMGPGDDFYQYVNEGWLENTEIPLDRSNYGSFSILEDATQIAIRGIIEEAAATNAEMGSDAQKVGDLYRSYTNLETRNKAGIKPIETWLEKVKSTTPQQLAKTWADLGEIGIYGPFGMYVEPDARKSEQYTVYLTQAGTSLPDRDYYLFDRPGYKETVDKFRLYIATLLTAVGHPDATAAAARIVELETKFAASQWTKVENRDSVKTYNKRTAEQMNELFSNMPWNDFATASGLEKQPEFIVSQPSFFEATNQLMKDTPVQTWQDYMTYLVADAFAPLLTEELEKLHFGFHDTVISGITEQKPLWKRGVDIVNGGIGEVVGKLYVEKYFSPLAKKRMGELVDNLKVAFGQRIDALEWMTPGTKKAAQEKLALFSTKIGYPDKWKDYSDLEISADDIIANAMSIARWEHNRQLAKLGQPIDRTEWLMTPQTINAYYNPLMNEIVFPAAILQPPFFNLEADDAVNYGGIGAVIGHEISHGFDDQGSTFDGKGNLRNWWSEEDRVEFEKRASQLVKQYNAYKPFEDMQVNGELTLGENIGDLGGLSVSYTAYRLSLDGKEAPVIDGLTGDQRFFLGWSQIWRRKYREPELRKRLVTDPHSPSQYRVDGIVSNMDEFYKAFDIKPDQPMYIAPESRVRIW